MEKRELTCIGCPMGCQITVTIESGNISVAGNTCRRGEDYAKKEVTSPARTVTSTVPVADGQIPMVSVKTKEDIPKGKIFECMAEIRNTFVVAPVHIGDIIIENCAGTGVPVVATKEVGKADTI